MPKQGSTRYQKFLKSEKAKTKLKAKANLPKGTNVTKTNFKVKKIVIKEQLKKHDGSEALSTRKLNIKDLLSRLNHFNVNSRMDSLNGLKELISNHPDVLENNLGPLIRGVTPLILNVEKLVRRESLKLLHLILSNTLLEKTEPFFDIMSTYLRSSMTHIDNRIQQDSLLLLDTLLLCIPERMSQDFYRIIPNFLDMISKLRVGTKNDRSLSMVLDNGITSSQWRVRVLHRLKDFIQTFIICNKIDAPETPISNKTKLFDDNQFNHYPLFNENYITVCRLSCFSKSSQEEQGMQDEVESFKAYIDTLIPLLVETWLEVCPNANKGKNIETVLSEDAANLLKHMLNLFSLIWTLVKHLDTKYPSSDFVKYFCQKYRNSFNQHIFQAFPYVTNARSKQKKDSVFENMITDPKLVVENLETCYLFICFNPNINLKGQDTYLSSFYDYIEKSFKNFELSINEVLMKILHTIFTKKGTNWTRNEVMMSNLLDKIFNTYADKDIPSDVRQNTFALLCLISLNDNLRHLHLHEGFQNWLKNLPDILLQESVTAKTVDIIHKFAVRNNKVFNSVIKSKLKEILTNLPNIKISDSNDDAVMFRLFSLFHWIRCWNDECLNLVEGQLLNSKYDGDIAKYIFDTLKLKTEGVYH